MFFCELNPKPGVRVTRYACSRALNGGRSTPFGTRGRRFKSCHSDQLFCDLDGRETLAFLFSGFL